jgi:MFS family permease
MAGSAVATSVEKGPWYQGLTPKHWRVLWASFLGWIFDGYETFALIVAIGPILTTLLPPEARSQLGAYAGLTIGVTLLGWGVGGVIGGTITDYIGRKRMMIYSILGYAFFTGLTALSWSVESLIALRFLTGIAMGSEWSTGATLIAETWPDRARPKGAGFMQSGFGFGTFLASLVWYLVHPLGAQAWRWLFVVGVMPAFFVFYIRRKIDESQRWIDTVREKRWAATEVDLEILGPQGKRPFTLTEIFQAPESRRRVLLTFAMSLTTMVGWYAVSSLLPGYVASIAKGEGYQNLAFWGSTAGMIYNAGAIAGYLSSGFLADWMGRRKYLAFLFIGSLILTPITYVWTHDLQAVLIAAAINGFFTLGQYSWFAIYLPELFSTAVRSTAASFIFNATRLIAFMGPIVAASIVKSFGGISTAAMSLGMIYFLGLAVCFFLPETKGKPLPG